MSWLVVITLALLCLGAMAVLLGPENRRQGLLVSALVLVAGLLFYALQASPNVPGSPRQAVEKRGEEGWRMVDLRKQLVAEDRRSRSNFIITADALARQGQYANAATLLRGVVDKNPNDGEAWLAMANALAFHADGALTPASLIAYRRAAQAEPDSAGPTFFVGLAMIRSGGLVEAHKLWSQRLASMPEGAAGRDFLAGRLAELQQLMLRIAENADETGR